MKKLILLILFPVLLFSQPWGHKITIEATWYEHINK